MPHVLTPDRSIHDLITDGLREASTRNNLSRKELINEALSNSEAMVGASGALGTWTPTHSTGRIPKDTYIVKHPNSAYIDWSSKACIPMDPDIFDALVQDALNVLKKKSNVYTLDRSVGHDPKFTLPVKLVTDRALSALFADNMFVSGVDASKSIFRDTPFTIIALPTDPVASEKYTGHVRDGVPRLIAMDFDRRIGLVYGLPYCGGIKKSLFTAMNYLLPQYGVLPLHCSANESSDDSALFLGLSGTGKTTLSNDPSRTLIGDDEHAWTDDGVFNMEGGCYAKLINLDPSKEPDIHKAVFEKKPVEESGCIIENALMYPNGEVDVSDSRFTENSRASYTLDFLSNTKSNAVTMHPKTILFLAADANGVLPPVANLNESEAMLWFLMGYTSKLAGTEVGITKPASSFSRFFGEPFMPLLPNMYADLLGKKLREHHSNVYLINTGWTGGAYGTGTRFDINLSRSLVDAALDGTLEGVEYRRDVRFKLSVPVVVPGIDNDLLDPAKTWDDQHAYTEAADALANDFAKHFEKAYGNADLDEGIRDACPGL